MAELVGTDANRVLVVMGKDAIEQENTDCKHVCSAGHRLRMEIENVVDGKRQKPVAPVLHVAVR